MVKVDCPYKDVCTSYGTWKCSRCRHNRRRDYFEPAKPDWIAFPTPPRRPWERVYCERGMIYGEKNLCKA